MYPSRFHFFPLALPFVLGLFLLVVFLVAFVEVGVLGYAYEKVGVDRRYVFTLLVLSLVGSGVNIPVAELPPSGCSRARRSSSSACATWSRWSKTGRARSSPCTWAGR